MGLSLWEINGVGGLQGQPHAVGIGPGEPGVQRFRK